MKDNLLHAVEVTEGHCRSAQGWSEPLKITLDAIKHGHHCAKKRPDHKELMVREMIRFIHWMQEDIHNVKRGIVSLENDIQAIKGSLDSVMIDLTGTHAEKTTPKNNLLDKLRFIEEKHCSIESWLDVLLETLVETMKQNHPKNEKNMAWALLGIISWMEEDHQEAKDGIASLVNDIEAHEGSLHIVVIDWIAVDGEPGHLRNGKKFHGVNSSFAHFDAHQLTDEEENSDDENEKMVDPGPAKHCIFDDDSDDSDCEF